MLERGSTIADVILEELVARGGQGALWRASRGEARVALKVVEKGPRVEAEWQRLRGLDHPSVVRALDVIYVDADHAGLVLGWVDGVPLDEAARDPRWSPRHGERAIHLLLDALAYVHEAGVVHRDVKPSNVLVSERFLDGADDLSSVVLVDFGIAAPIDNPSPLTETGGRIGTVSYLAPESLLEHTPRVEPSRDVFALGVVGWELLAGRHPLGQPPADADRWVWFTNAYREAVAGRRPFPEGEVAGDIGRMLGACLALDPSERPSDARAALVPAPRLASPRAPRNDEATIDVPRVEPTFAPLARTPASTGPGKAWIILPILLLVAAGVAAAVWATLPRNVCKDARGIPIDPPSKNASMKLRSAPDYLDDTTAIMDLPRDSVVELLDKEPRMARDENWYRVRVVCSPAPSGSGREGVVNAVGFPSLLDKKRLLRRTEITMQVTSRKAFLEKDTRVGIITVPARPQKYVRVLDGPESGNAGHLSAADLEP